MQAQHYGPYRSHWALENYPLMRDDEFTGLVEDIAANGLYTPILLWTDNTGDEWIVDGRNRWRALERLGKNPRGYCVELERDPEEADAIEAVVSHNTQRRSMNSSQNAMLAVILEPRYNEALRLRNAQRRRHPRDEQDTLTPRQRTDEAMLRHFRTSTTMIKYARRVFARGLVELQRAVLDGLISAKTAAELTDCDDETLLRLLDEGPAACRRAAKEIREQLREARAPVEASVEPGVINFKIADETFDSMQRISQQASALTGRHFDAVELLEELISTLERRPRLIAELLAGKYPLVVRLEDLGPYDNNLTRLSDEDVDDPLDDEVFDDFEKSAKVVDQTRPHPAGDATRTPPPVVFPDPDDTTIAASVHHDDGADDLWWQEDEALQDDPPTPSPARPVTPPASKGVTASPTRSRRSSQQRLDPSTRDISHVVSHVAKRVDFNVENTPPEPAHPRVDDGLGSSDSKITRVVGLYNEIARAWNEQSSRHVQMRCVERLDAKLTQELSAAIIEEPDEQVWSAAFYELLALPMSTVMRWGLFTLEGLLARPHSDPEGARLVWRVPAFAQQGQQRNPPYQPVDPTMLPREPGPPKVSVPLENEIKNIFEVWRQNFHREDLRKQLFMFHPQAVVIARRLSEGWAPEVLKYVLWRSARSGVQIVDALKSASHIRRWLGDPDDGS